MKKYIITAIVVVGIGFIVYFFHPHSSPASNRHLFISKKEISDKHFLDNKKAVIYFSTTADQDQDGNGISFAVFIDESGKAQALKMEGLELGTISKGNNKVFLEEKDRVRIMGDQYKEFPMKKDQYTGERTGYIQKKDLFFSIYNSGFDKKEGYRSDVRFGNENQFNTGMIPYYIASSGLNDDQVNVLTFDLDKNLFNLKKVTFQNGLKIDNITKINTPKSKEFTSLAPVLSDNRFFYIIMSAYMDDHNEKVTLFKIEKKNNTQEMIPFIHYQNMDEVSATLPYNTRNSAYIFKNDLYYINGLGEVYCYNSETGKITKKFTLKNISKSKIRHNEETFYQDQFLFVLRFNPNKKSYYIEKYSLETGDLVHTENINGLEDILSSVKGKSVYSYDFKML